MLYSKCFLIALADPCDAQCTDVFSAYRLNIFKVNLKIMLDFIVLPDYRYLGAM